MHKLSNEQIGILWIIGASIAYGIMPIWSVISQNNGISTDFILFFRFLCSAFLLFLWALYKQISLKLTKLQYLQFFFLGGILYIIQSFACLDSLRYIPASLSVLIYHIYPIIVTLIALIFLRQKLQAKTLFSLFLCFAGLAIILQPQKDLELSVYGVILSLIGALFYGLYVVFSKSYTSNLSSVVCSFYICLFAALMILGFMIPNPPQFDNFNLNGILSLLGLTFISTLFPMMAYFLGMPRINVTKTAILGMIEPLVGVLLSLWLLGENLNLLQYFGGFLILFGSLVLFIKR